MPDAESSSEIDQMEANTRSPGIPMSLPDLPCEAALRRPVYGRLGRYDFWLMQQRVQYVAPQMHLMPAYYIRGPRMRGGLMRSHMHLMGEPREPSVNFQGGRGLGLPRGMQHRGMQRRDMGPRHMEPPRMAPGDMMPPQGIEPQGSRKQEHNRPRGMKNEGVEPREPEKKMKPPRGIKRRGMGSPDQEPQEMAPGGLEPPKDDNRP